MARSGFVFDDRWSRVFRNRIKESLLPKIPEKIPEFFPFYFLKDNLIILINLGMAASVPLSRATFNLHNFDAQFIYSLKHYVKLDVARLNNKPKKFRNQQSIAL